MKLNINRIRETQEKRKKRESRGGNYWKCGKGVNRIRLALFPSTVTGNEEYCREFRFHQQQGTQPIVCGKSPDRFGNEADNCPECDRAQVVFEEDGKEAARPLWARDRTAYLVVPLEKGSNEFKNPRLYPFWAASTVAKQIDAILADCDECADVRDYFGPEGLDFKITFNPKASPSEMYQVKVMPKVRCESLDPALFADVAKHDLYRNDDLEPTGWVDEGNTPEPAAAPAQEPSPAERPPQTPPKKQKAAKPDGPGEPNSEGYFDADNAARFLGYYGFDAEGWTTQSDEEGDTAFIAPDGTVSWDPPEVSPERQAAARGMTPKKEKRKAAPPAETGEDDAGE